MVTACDEDKLFYKVFVSYAFQGSILSFQLAQFIFPGKLLLINSVKMTQSENKKTFHELCVESRSVLKVS